VQALAGVPRWHIFVPLNPGVIFGVQPLAHSWGRKLKCLRDGFAVKSAKCEIFDCFVACHAHDLFLSVDGLHRAGPM
jgi:hypothetical protein